MHWSALLPPPVRVIRYQDWLVWHYLVRIVGRIDEAPPTEIVWEPT